MTLNLIAFAFHSVCDYLCQLWQTACAQYSRRRRLFLAIDLLTEWQHFDSWHAVLSPIGNPRQRPIADPTLRGPLTHPTLSGLKAGLSPVFLKTGTH